MYNDLNPALVPPVVSTAVPGAHGVIIFVLAAHIPWAYIGS